MTAPIPDEFLDLMAEKFRMLADSTRLAILRALMEGEKNVTQVVEETGRNQANVSKHLKMLAEAGLVGRRKEGLQVFYQGTAQIPAKIYAKGFWAVSLALKVVFSDLRLRKKGNACRFRPRRRPNRSPSSS